MKPRPTDAHTRADDLQATPFAHVLIDLLEAERNGSLLVYAEDGTLYAAIRIENGRPTAALAEHGEEHNLAMLLIPLCGWTEGRFEFLEEQDMVGHEEVLRGSVDPLMLIAAAARGPLREELIERTLTVISRSLIKKTRTLDASRYGFTAQEQCVLDALDSGLMDLEALRKQARVPEHVLRRVLYVLRMTRGIALLPTHRMVSGTLVRTVPPAARNAQPSTRSSEPSARPSGTVPRSAALPAQPEPRPAAPPPPAPPEPPAAVSQKPAAPSRKPVPPRRPSTPFGDPGDAPTQPAARVSRPSASGAHSLPPDTRVSRPSASGAHSLPPATSSQQPPAAPSQQPGVRSQRPSNPGKRPSSPNSMAAALPPARVSSQPSGRYSMHEAEQGRERLPSDSLAESADPKVRRQQAEALWNKAEAQYRRGDLGAALQTARTAVKLGHSAPEHDALLGWLIFQHGSGDESVLPHVWKCIDRALKRDPLCEQALFYKGLLLSHTGNAEQALAHLQRVLTLNPNHHEAQREVRINEMRQEHERQQSGFFRRLLSARPTGKDGE